MSGAIVCAIISYLCWFRSELQQHAEKVFLLCQENAALQSELSLKVADVQRDGSLKLGIFLYHS
jgi:hypothetical protein